MHLAHFHRVSVSKKSRRDNQTRPLLMMASIPLDALGKLQRGSGAMGAYQRIRRGSPAATAGLWGVLAVLVTLASATAAQPGAETEFNSFNCTSTDDELQLLYRENLEPDFALWRNRTLTTADIERLSQQFPSSDVRRMVLVYNGQAYLPMSPDPTKCEQPCNHLLDHIYEAIKMWHPEIQFPNSLFYLSACDRYSCLPHEACAAPPLAISKLADHPKLGSASDILIPKASTKRDAMLVEYPWHLKDNRAVWRGTRWCDGAWPDPPIHCSRWHMAEVVKQDNATGLFDFGYTSADPNIAPNFTLSKNLDHAALSKYKFLLNLDGFSAAYRLARLMLTNSVVLKEESHRVEYFYRSMRPYQHYIPIFKTDPWDPPTIVREYQKPEKLPELKRIARNAQTFVQKYACPNARMLYWRKVLVEYNKLFPDMDEAIKNKWLPMVEKKLGRKLDGQETKTNPNRKTRLHSSRK